MSLYKYATYIKQTADAAFDSINHPGAPTPHSAIYRCEGCGREVVSEYPNPLPPQNHHQHTVNQGSIRWRMIVWADHNPK